MLIFFDEIQIQKLDISNFGNKMGCFIVFYNKYFEGSTLNTMGYLSICPNMIKSVIWSTT